MSSKLKQVIAIIFLIVSIMFAILTVVGIYLALVHTLDSFVYSVVPLLFTLTFGILYRNFKKCLKKE